VEETTAGSARGSDLVHNEPDARVRTLPIDTLLKEASVLLQIHEEGTNFPDSRFVDFRELVAQQLLGELLKWLALILFEPQIVPM
jgi:hypothetical protein